MSSKDHCWVDPADLLLILTTLGVMRKTQRVLPAIKGLFKCAVWSGGTAISVGKALHSLGGQSHRHLVLGAMMVKHTFGGSCAAARSMARAWSIIRMCIESSNRHHMNC